ncbi:hypothetical protein P280DRAFT_551481 [Massarina eburnea CBS 473.64]|uniref:TEA domain-containing protein n=1 Tax=Massarina eburnea CBS 473.64 TaxID=1395130 RepID=A0A6A6RVW4_9PLEO|nr:hypothetical protein P280DRAFT_551481 [Massarina eburnea CBS 473.64]
MMDLQYRSCVLPSNAPALSGHDSSIPSPVLQERSVNTRKVYTEASSQWKRSVSPRLGSYFTRNRAPRLNEDKSDVEIEHELRKLMALMKQCEKYQKYRDRQPSTKKDREQFLKWPDHLEEAFFRGLIRWPPMGRRQHMLDGKLRGRNELVAHSIEWDTQEPRTRKQVSSHLQVLRNYLIDCPQVLLYMPTADLSGKKSRHGHSHFGHHRSRHASSKYDQAASSMYQEIGNSSSVALAKIQNGHGEAPYTVDDFGIFVEAGEQKQRVHRFTEIANNSWHNDINVYDTTSWHKQFPEFNFHRTDEFKSRNVIACDASIKVMTMERPAQAELSIAFDLRSKVNLAMYDSLECSTRFFDNGKTLDQHDEHEGKVKSTCTAAEYYPEHYPEQEGLLRVRFGASFWACQMQKMGNYLRKAGEEEQSTRLKYENAVRKELQYMTAAQDIYGVRDGEKKCFLTILWRFSQTRTNNELGRMTWRVVNFGLPRERRHIVKEEIVSVNTSSTLVSIPTSSSASIYPSLPLEFSQPFTHHPPPLDLDSLAIEAMASEFSNPNSASAPSLSTDYSQQSHSLPSLSHSQDLSVGTQHSQDYHDPVNDFDFNGGHVTISGCLEPAINLGNYEAYSDSQGFNALPSMVDLGHAGQHHHSDADAAAFNDLAALGVTMPPHCYATKPSWHHPSLIPHLENQAEHYSEDLMMQATGGGQVENGNVNVVGQGVLEGQLQGAGMWKLQAAFGEDTGVGAMVGLGDGRKDSLVGGKVGIEGFGFLERRDERMEERFRAY